MIIPQFLQSIKDKYISVYYASIMKRFASLFDQMADPIVQIPPEDIIGHQVSNYTYYPPEDRPNQAGEFILEHLFEDEEKSCVYVNHTTKTWIIGFRGTMIDNMKDLMSDVKIVLGASGLDKRVMDSLNIFDTVRAKYPDYKKQVCGHSLGGTICYIIAKHREPDRCIVFNPGSAPNTLFIQMLTDTVQKAEWTRNVYTYKILGDMISTFSFVGNTKLFRVSEINPDALHTLDRFKQPNEELIPLKTSSQ